MPIYEIDCPECGKQEIYRKTPTSVRIAPCPECGRPCRRNWNSIGRPEWFTPYYTGAFGTGNPLYVGSKKDEQKLLQQTGCERVN